MKQPLPKCLPAPDEPLPVSAPPYSAGLVHYSPVSAILITNRTLATNVRPSVPSVVKLEAEPLITGAILTYFMSTLGAYNEYFHLVEATYQNETFNPISMILDNEAAIFLGREMYGYPKSLWDGLIGACNWLSNISRDGRETEGQRPVQADFTPEESLEGTVASPRESKRVLGLTVIPSPDAAAKVSFEELVLSRISMRGGESWIEKGSITFPTPMESHPMHKLEVLKYDACLYVREVSATIFPANVTYPSQGTTCASHEYWLDFEPLSETVIEIWVRYTSQRACSALSRFKHQRTGFGESRLQGGQDRVSKPKSVMNK